jgi:Domain of Unknown Function (DUF1080)
MPACVQSGGAQLQHEKHFTSRRTVLVSRATKNSREDMLMKHLSAVAIAVLIGTAAFQFSNPVSGQSDGGWVTLVDSTKMGDWDEVGKANWAMKDGALVADKLDGKDASYLVSKNSYKDFQIKAEFWTDEEANSGIFLRCDQSKKIDAKICYEVNIFDKRPDPTYGTGAIVDSPRSTRCRRPPASGIRMKSPRRGRISWSCSTGKRRPMYRMQNTRAALSPCNTAPVW